MKLYEYEGKNLFTRCGIPVPYGILVSSADTALDGIEKPVVKAQTLAGGRGKSNAVVMCQNVAEARSHITSLLGSTIKDEIVEKILVEERVAMQEEYYMAIAFDTEYRAPVFLFSATGGVDIETVRDGLHKHVIDMDEGFLSWIARRVIKNAGVDSFRTLKLSAIAMKLWNCFWLYDCRVAEINPLIWDGYDYVAADAKIILDDDALFRHGDLGLQPRNEGKVPTQRELDAKKIDENDHRGTAGSTYVDLDGDIAIIAAGGGAAMTCMDALLAHGGKPANFTEHSGNPPAEKLEKLTKIVLSKPGLHGLWLVGGTANFTDIYETLRGFLNGLRQIQPKPDYPIVIRRGGPRDKEAFEMLAQAKEEGFDFHLFGNETPMTETAKTIVGLVAAYKKKVMS